VRSKYNAKPTIYNGARYASKRESEVAAMLDTMKKARGKDRVDSWVGQPRFPLLVNGVKVCTYVADFMVVYADNRTEIWDVKGVLTPVFKLKMKLYEALGNPKVRLVK
jgi:hypothetical protein